MNKLLVQHLTADNDTNGNPRRLYMIYKSNGAFLQSIDEGYHGDNAYTSVYPTATFTDLAPVNITPKEYRRLLRLTV